MDADRLAALLDAANVNPAQRLELRAAPELAVELLEYALARPRIKSPAAFAVARFRARLEARRRLELEERGDRAELGTEEELESALAFARAYGLPAPALAAIEADLHLARTRAALAELEPELAGV